MRKTKRDIIFQSLKLILWSIIAVALVKFAFFPNQETNEELLSQGQFELPTVTAEIGDISNSVELNASVVRDESKQFKSTESGVVQTLYVKDGDQVAAGAPVLQLEKTTVKEVPGQPSTDEEGNTIPGTPQQVEHKTWHDIYAPASGTLRLDTLVGQQVEIGSPLGSIVPSTFHAQVSINPEQLYSLQGLPKVATLAIKDGPAPFECTNLQTITSTGGTKEGEQSSGPQLRCVIPANQTVFDGVKGKLSIAGSSATQVVVVPTSAVEGRFREGAVYFPSKDGKSKPERHVVKLGISDGQFIEVTEGLKQGDLILEFAPLNQEEQQRPGDNQGGGFGE